MCLTFCPCIHKDQTNQLQQQTSNGIIDANQQMQHNNNAKVIDEILNHSNSNSNGSTDQNQLGNNVQQKNNLLDIEQNLQISSLGVWYNLFIF